ncbi:hypothetical protein LS71_008840 [Helicobacter jaachi]|uniref:Uncharacterized protein n=2 Tax=Helicobacter jaachi TaxID=1677920 RepID=A0A4U8T896_9HELI|nr:hypothetical protein LS71_008840 [Helicobacter jaachi]
MSVYQYKTTPESIAAGQAMLDKRYDETIDALNNTSSAQIEQIEAERAGELEQKEKDDAYDDAASDFSSAVETNSKDVSYALNNPEEQQQLQDLPQTPLAYGADTQEGGGYKKFRNTGVHYFDSKQKLSLYDAWVAKSLGLNVSFVHQKIDMKLDNKTRNTDLSRTNRNFIAANKSAYNLSRALLGMLSFKKGKYQRGVAEMINKATGGAIKMGDNLEYFLSNKRDYENTYAGVLSGRYSGDNGREVTDKGLERAREGLKTFDSGKQFIANTITSLDKILSDMALERDTYASVGGDAQMSDVHNREITKLKRLRQELQSLDGDNPNEKSIFAISALLKAHIN